MILGHVYTHHHRLEIMSWGRKLQTKPQLNVDLFAVWDTSAYAFPTLAAVSLIHDVFPKIVSPWGKCTWKRVDLDCCL